MFLDCALNYIFFLSVSFIFLCLITLWRYIGVGAGAGARAVAGVDAGEGAGAGVEVGADKKNTYMKTDLAPFVVFWLRHVTCGFLKKRRNYFNCSH